MIRTILLSTLATSVCHAGEVRSVWVTRWDYRSAHDIRTVVSNCASLGLNRIYLQVRGQADAFYRSRLEPWGEELGGDPGFDPLALAIDECARRGIELYAWVNVLPGWKGTRPPRSRRHVFHARPDWFLRDRNGQQRRLDTERYALLNPCLPEVRAHLVAVVADICSRYRVDGVQFDYIRFQSRNVARGEDVPYDSRTLARFRELTGGYPTRFPARWDEFRKDAMATLVSELCAAVRRSRPGASISVAAVMDLDLARNHYFQDVGLWWRSGWIDEVCPMLYTSDAATFRAGLDRFMRALPAPATVAGVGIYRAGSDAITRQIAIARGRRASGYALFGYTSLFLSRSPHSLRTQAAADRRARMRKAIAGLNRPAVETAARQSD